MAENFDDLIDELRHLETSLVSQLQGSRLAGGGSFSFDNPFLTAGGLRPSVSGLSRVRAFCSRAKNKYNSSHVSSTNEARDGTKSKACRNGAGNGRARTRVAASNPFLKDRKIAEPTVPTNTESHSNDKTATKHKDSDNGIGGANIFGGSKTSNSLVEKYDFFFDKNVHERDEEEKTKSYSDRSSTSDAHDDSKSEAFACRNGAGNGRAKYGVVVSNPFLKDLTVAEPTESTNTEAHSNVNDKSATRYKGSDDEIGGANIFRGANIFSGVNISVGSKTSNSLVGKCNYLFDTNVHELDVVEEYSKSGKIVFSNKENNCSAASGDSNLFSSRVIQNATVKSTENVGKEPNVEFKSLTDKPQKRKYEEIPTEVNILNCKLFTYVNSHWEEHGRGSLCLNDAKTERNCSRLVFKTGGNERLLLNTKVWAGMITERQDQKTLRLTARDSCGESKKYLVRAQPKKITHLHSALIERINSLRSAHRAKMLRWN